MKCLGRFHSKLDSPLLGTCREIFDEVLKRSAGLLVLVLHDQTFSGFFRYIKLPYYDLKLQKPNLHILGKNLFVQKCKNNSVVPVDFIQSGRKVSNSKLESTLGRTFIWTPLDGVNFSLIFGPKFIFKQQIARIWISRNLSPEKLWFTPCLTTLYFDLNSPWVISG